MGGCCFSSPRTSNTVDLTDSPSPPPPPPSQDWRQQPLKDGSAFRDGSWRFTVFSFSDLQETTDNFSSDRIVSENGEESSNVVYRGPLRDLGFVAIKKFKIQDWPNPDEFTIKAERVGNLSHKRIVNLLGYCCEGNEKLLVSDFMPNGTLHHRLFHQTDQTMDWAMRYRVAYCIAEALDYCSSTRITCYNNLTAHSILFDKNDEACLSCFGLVKRVYYDPIKERWTEEAMDSGSATYRFAIVLLNLLTGKQIPLDEAAEMLHEKNCLEVMDPKLEGKYSVEEASAVFKLASYCIQYTTKYQKFNLIPKLESFKSNTEQGESSSSQQQQQKLEENITKVEVVEENEDNASSSTQV